MIPVELRLIYYLVLDEIKIAEQKGGGLACTCVDDVHAMNLLFNTWNGLCKKTGHAKQDIVNDLIRILNYSKRSSKND